ncbi:hypothetical protein OH492_28605 [Vibrio chagasii]|nr:hypothetical protein [Vibrio chagasii]
MPVSPKIQIPELSLSDNTILSHFAVEDIRLGFVLKEGKMSYPIPVDDFGFDIRLATDESKSQHGVARRSCSV